MADRASSSFGQWAVGRPKKACGQCKKQKLRCSGDRPICKRCSRLGHKCAYQLPFATRTSKSPRVVTAANKPPPTSASTNQERNSSAIIHSDEVALSTPVRIAASFSTAPSQEYYLGIPSTLVSSLIDIYYANVYNATLLLHRPSFLEAVADGSARSHVVLSVCAWSANFYRDESGKSSLKDHGFMMEWADRAGKLVFEEAENPHEDNIVTFMNLALLFYSQGMWRRSITHRGNGTLLAQILGFGSDTSGKEDLWESEVRRRRFWACYLMDSHASEHTSILSARPSVSTLELTLPWREEDFEARKSSQPRTWLASDQSNEGLFCELIKAMTIWSAVNTLMKTPETKMESRISAIHALERQISDWWEKLPACLHLAPSSVPQIALDVLPKLLLVHTVYHQSLATLHASIVPVFCWISGDNRWLRARQTSAQVALDHACAASDLFQAVLKHFSMLSAIPSFVAYAAYCGCAIQIPFMWCSEATVRERSHRNVRINTRIIATLSQYWKFASLFEIYVQRLYQTHANNPTPLEDEPKNINPSKLTGFKFNAGNASETILGFNRILWTKSGGYAQPGEEMTDLSMEDEEASEIQAAQEPNGNRNSQTQGLVNMFPTPPELQDQPPSALYRFNSSSNLTAPGGKQMQPELCTIPPELPNLDFFLPFDPDMTGLNGDALDFSQFDTNPLIQDVFSGWERPLTQEDGSAA